MESYIQFSIDDTLAVLKELTQKRPSSVFEIQPFQFFKQLHTQYGLVVSFYAFFEDDDNFTLAEVTDTYKSEFAANSDWLKFGVHSTNKRTSFIKEDGVAEYRRIHAQLKRIAGETCIDTCFRPHFFAIGETTLRTLKEENLAQGVHCPDDDRKSHAFTLEEKISLEAEGFLQKDGIAYIKTQTRLEQVSDENISELFEKWKHKKMLSVFTHEYCLGREDIRRRIEAVCRFAEKNKLTWAFPADILKR